MGGGIAIVKNGDGIIIDAEKNRITLDISQKEFKARMKKWKAPAYKVRKGMLYKYIKNVSSASEGCVTDRE